MFLKHPFLIWFLAFLAKIGTFISSQIYKIIKYIISSILGQFKTEFDKIDDYLLEKFNFRRKNNSLNLTTEGKEHNYVEDLNSRRNTTYSNLTIPPKNSHTHREGIQHFIY